MIRLPKTQRPPIELGMTSLVLGFTGLLLFFLPILGLPLSAAGGLFAIIGTGIALAGGPMSLRWSVFGILLCAIAIGVNVLMTYPEAGKLPERAVPQSWQQVPDRPWVSPPARPGFWGARRSDTH